MGNAVISRYPIKDSDYHELNPDDVDYDGNYRTEPRILVEAEISVDDKNICFLTTHLQYSYKFETTDIRREQVENIVSVVKRKYSPIVLTGDFNSTLENKEINMLDRELQRLGGEEPTWTVKPFEHKGWEVDDLKYRLDHIFVANGVNYLDSDVIETEISDHLPVVAKIEI